MKRLLLLEDATEMGGVQHSTLNLLRGLQGDPEIEAFLLLPGEGSFAEACREYGLPYELYPKIPLTPSSISVHNDRFRLPNLPGLARNIGRSRAQIRQLLPILEQHQADIVLTKGMGAHLNGGRACRKLRIPCIWHQQDFISERYGGAYRLLFGRLAARYADFLIADGTPIRAQLPPALQQRCEVVFNGVPLSQFYQPGQGPTARKSLNLPEDAYVIGHLARLTPWKGQHLLIDAFAQYARQRTNAHLMLVGSPLFEGEGYREQLHRQIQQHGLETRIHLPGYRNDLGFVLSAMDTFIYPSVEKDTSPLALISAMAAGLPVGVSNIAGLKEMIDGCGGAVLFENRNTAEMAAIMQQFESAAARQQAGEACRQWAQQHFSLEAYTLNIKKILKRFI